MAFEKRAPRPHHGKTFVLTPTKGHVIVYRRGNRKIAGVPVSLPIGGGVPHQGPLRVGNGPRSNRAAVGLALALVRPG